MTATDSSSSTDFTFQLTVMASSIMIPPIRFSSLEYNISVSEAIPIGSTIQRLGVVFNASKYSLCACVVHVSKGTTMSQFYLCSIISGSIDLCAHFCPFRLWLQHYYCNCSFVATFGSSRNRSVWLSDAQRLPPGHRSFEPLHCPGLQVRSDSNCLYTGRGASECDRDGDHYERLRSSDKRTVSSIHGTACHAIASVRSEETPSTCRTTQVCGKIYRSTKNVKRKCTTDKKLLILSKLVVAPIPVPPPPPPSSLTNATSNNSVAINFKLLLTVIT